MELRLRRATPVFVYQMGKVGSGSVRDFLLEQYERAVLHAHEFTEDHKKPRIRRLYEWVETKSRTLNVISLTREPISRNVSAFFKNLEKFMGVSYTSSGFSIGDMKSILLSDYWHNIPLKWFDRNILANFSIDFFATPFRESGTCLYHNDNVRLLVLQSELPDSRKVEAIADFLGLDSFELRNVNVGTEKDYVKAYRAFQQGVSFPDEYITLMCETKYFTHFYSDEVVEATRRKWAKT